MSATDPQRPEQAPVGDVRAHVEAFLAMLGIPEEGDDGRNDDGRL
jgi:hypothetical protein